MTERVCNSPLSKPVRPVNDGCDRYGSIAERALRERVRISNKQVQPDRGAVEALRAEIACLRRLVGDAEMRALDGEFRNNHSVRIGHTVDLDGAEGLLVELNG